MKRTKKILLSAILLSPVLLLTACVPPPSYLITASTYGTNWGRILGAETEEKEENSKITLSAVELESETHPFVCWIKDYGTVYSTEKEIELIYNEEAQGHYTAVFHEDASSMLFASLNSITIENAEYTNVTYTLNYSSNSSGSNNYSLFSEGEFEPASAYMTDNSSVLYFGPIGNVVEYKFEILTTFSNPEGEEQTYTLKFSTKLEENLFSNGKCELTGSIENTDINIKLNFEKISYSMYHSLTEEE